jgi:hypothetical protein
VTTNLDTLVTALYVKIVDEQAKVARLPGRPSKLGVPRHSGIYAECGEEWLALSDRVGVRAGLPGPEESCFRSAADVGGG